MRSRSLVVLAIVAFVSAASSMAYADVVVGPGNQTGTVLYDAWIPDFGGNATGMVIDTATAPTVAAGLHHATNFSYEFSGYDNVGTLTPFLATKSGADFVPVAVGSAVTYAANTSYGSHAFGGAGAFTLAAAAQVYAGFYWNAATATGLAQCPIGYVDGVGSDEYWSGMVSAPVIGTAVGAGAGAHYVMPGPIVSSGRAYEFSITMDAVPEPSAIAMLLVCGFGLLAYAWRKRR